MDGAENHKEDEAGDVEAVEDLQGTFGVNPESDFGIGLVE